MILCFLSVSGCGGAYADAVTLNACISEEPLSIPLKNGIISNVPLFFPYRCFSTLESFDEIKKEIEQAYPYATIKELENGTLIIKLENDDRIHFDYYVLSYTHDVNEERWYLIDNLCCTYYAEDLDNSSYEDKQLLLFPKYYFGNMASAGIDLYNDKEKECSFQPNIRDICDFYNESGYYKAECSDDEVIIKAGRKASLKVELKKKTG